MSILEIKSPITVEGVRSFVEQARAMELPLILWVGLNTWIQLGEYLGNPVLSGALVYANGRLWMLGNEIKKSPDCPEGWFYDAPRIYAKSAFRQDTGWRRL